MEGLQPPAPRCRDSELCQQLICLKTRTTRDPVQAASLGPPRPFAVTWGEGPVQVHVHSRRAGCSALVVPAGLGRGSMPRKPVGL